MANIIFNGERKTFSFKTRMFAFTTFIQHGTRRHTWENQAEKSNKRHPNWKERSEIISVHIILYIDTLIFPQENYEN